jgi:hypothetical protein
MALSIYRSESECVIYLALNCFHTVFITTRNFIPLTEPFFQVATLLASNVRKLCGAINKR